ncbi:hypothetical protein M2138_000997 [Dysgonomonadaceae bacterium PH5-43]|nr:hypothetical protein [Dysgonomonadaceae bacterium PH5-43]
MAVTYLVTSKINAGHVKQGMSVLIEMPSRKEPGANEITKAFKEQKGISGTTATHNPKNFTITEVK